MSKYFSDASTKSNYANNNIFLNSSKIIGSRKGKSVCRKNGGNQKIRHEDVISEEVSPTKGVGCVGYRSHRMSTAQFAKALKKSNYEKLFDFVSNRWQWPIIISKWAYGALKNIWQTIQKLVKKHLPHLFLSNILIPIFSNIKLFKH